MNDMAVLQRSSECKSEANPSIAFQRVGMYAFGQAAGYATDFLIFYLLITMSDNVMPSLAHLSGKVGSAALTYFYHVRFSFPGKKRNSALSSAIAYIGMLVINMALTVSLLKTFAFIVPTHIFIDKFVADCIGVVVTYFIMRFLVFPRAQAA